MGSLDDVAGRLIRPTGFALAKERELSVARPAVMAVHLLNAIPRDFRKERAGMGRAERAANYALGAVRDDEDVTRPGERHVEQAPLFIRIFGHGDDPIFDAGDEHNGKLQPFGGVECKKCDPFHRIGALAFPGEHGQPRKEGQKVCPVLPSAFPDGLVAEGDLGDSGVDGQYFFDSIDSGLDPMGGKPCPKIAYLREQDRQSVPQLRAGYRVCGIDQEA